jgi:hypothetical protein
MLGPPLSTLVVLAVLTLAVGEEWPNQPDTRLTMLVLPLSAPVGFMLAALMLATVAQVVPVPSGLTPMGVVLATLVLAVGEEWPNSPNA